MILVYNGGGGKDVAGGNRDGNGSRLWASGAIPVTTLALHVFLGQSFICCILQLLFLHTPICKSSYPFIYFFSQQFLFLCVYSGYFYFSISFHFCLWSLMVAFDRRFVEFTVNNNIGPTG
ncbi:hypothetical protein Hdeb2414_s0002g00059571 [Helianthus debilis subsp. tardiflorus]